MKWIHFLNTTRSRLIIIIISLCIYAIALFTPSLYFTITYNGSSPHTTPPEVWMGYEVLFFGWLGLFSGCITWYANLFYILVISAFYANAIKASTWLGLGMVLIIATIKSINYFHQISDESGNNFRSFDHFGPGTYLWILSLLFLYICVLIYRFNDAQLQKSDPTSIA